MDLTTSTMARRDASCRPANRAERYVGTGGRGPLPRQRRRAGPSGPRLTRPNRSQKSGPAMVVRDTSWIESDRELALSRRSPT